MGLLAWTMGGCTVWEICAPSPGPLLSQLTVGQNAGRGHFFASHYTYYTADLPVPWCYVHPQTDHATFWPTPYVHTTFCHCDNLLLWHFGPLTFYHCDRWTQWQFTTVTLWPLNILLLWQMDPVTIYYGDTLTPEHFTTVTDGTGDILLLRHFATHSIHPGN